MQWFRRKRSRYERIRQRGRDLYDAAAQRDVPWARSIPARMVREGFLNLVLQPVMEIYLRRRATGAEQLDRVKGPVILVANHSSHIDTPVILAALPRKLRKRTAVAAAADYFYRNRLVGAAVSLVFNTVPIDRTGGGMGQKSTGNLDKLLDQGWNLLVYPEGTRKGGSGRLRRGAAVLATRHNLPVVPIKVSGTSDAYPVGRFWPRRLRYRAISKRHPINVSFGDPIQPTDDPNALIEMVARFFESGKPDASNGANGSPSSSGKRLTRSSK